MADDKDTQPRDDDRNDELPGSPAPDPEEQEGAEDDPGAD
jgi:hypothetical protein